MMPNNALASVCESITNGTLVEDINNFSNEQILPHLPYLWALTTYSRDNGTLDVLRSRIVDFPISNTFKSFFSIDFSSIESELQSFFKSEQLTFDYKPYNSMEFAEKLIYVCKECIAINKIYGNVISSISARQFEPFDQELYHDEVVCIITLACQNFPSRIQLVTLACGLLCYKHGAKLLVKLILNQCNTIDLILQTFSELRFPSELFICHERDYVMLELFKLRPYSVGEYLNVLLDSENHFHLAVQVLSSKLVDTEMFITIFTKILSKSDDRFVKFLVKSGTISNVYARIQQIAESRNQTMDGVTAQLVILITKFFLHRGFRQSSIGIKFVLEYFAYLRTKEDGFLKTLLSSFVVCFGVGNATTDQKHVAEDFFQNLHHLVTKERFSSFTEFLLLVAIQFQSLVEANESSKFKHEVRAANDEELNRLFASTLGFKSELCRRMTDLMPYVKNAAKETIEICQEMFKDFRWNCSSIKRAPNFEHDLTKGTKEQAYVYALSSAAIVHQIAKACSKGELDYCKCGVPQSENSVYTNDADETSSTNELPTIPPRLNSEMDENVYRWQGCSDNIDYGVSASREWADAAWKSKLRMSRDLGPGGEFIWDQNELELLEEQNSILTTPASTRIHHDIKGINEGKKIIMNQQNNNVGRQIVMKSQFQKCKCHGVSSSCQVQTCWNTLPPFKAIAEGLKIKYLQAQQLSPKSHFLNPNTPPTTDLVYLRPSSNYCELTHDRECNATNPTSPSSCSNLCCERGHYAITVPVTEHCHCKYVHCCYVKCRACLFYVNKSYCN